MVLLPLLLLSINSGVCNAGGQSAVISAVRGDATAVDINGVVRKLRVNDTVDASEYIFTGARSRVKIVFKDRTIISLGERSTLRLEHYLWEKENNKGRFEVSVNEGVFRIIGGKITKTTPESFKTQTPAATIGIRGSSFAGTMRGKTLKVYLESGKGVDVYNGYGKVALLSPGVGTTVVAGSAPERAIPFSPGFIDKTTIQTDLAIYSGDDRSGGSEVKNSTIINRAVIRNSVNIAEGKNSRATMGSITIRQSGINRSTIVNNAEINNSVNISTGADSEASMGSTTIKESDVDGSTVVNDAEIDNSVNISSGSEAAMGSVDIR